MIPQETSPTAPSTDIVSAAELGGNASLDFSLVGMFVQADIIVQAVMTLLIVASVWSWAIGFNSGARLKIARKKADAFEDVFWSGNSLDELYQRLKAAPDHPMASVFVSAMLQSLGWR